MVTVCSPSLLNNPRYEAVLENCLRRAPAAATQSCLFVWLIWAAGVMLLFLLIKNALCIWKHFGAIARTLWGFSTVGEPQWCLWRWWCCTLMILFCSKATIISIQTLVDAVLMVLFIQCYYIVQVQCSYWANWQELIFHYIFFSIAYQCF